jgi:hypothetical protein
MEQTHDKTTQNLANQWWWQVARRNDLRSTRRLSRKLLVDAVARLHEGALLDNFWHCLHTLGS